LTSLRPHVGGAGKPEFKEETSTVLHLDHSFVRCWNLGTSESRPEIHEKFWNVVLEKDGEDRFEPIVW